jgi:hypothetical protein
MSDILQARDYQAIDPKDRNPRRSVEFRLRDGRRYWLKHTDRHLMALAPDQASLAIFYYSVNVVMWGTALAGIASAIDEQSVAWVQEFDPLRWDRPADGQAIIVERMEIFLKQENDDTKADDAREPGEAADHRARH